MNKTVSSAYKVVSKLDADAKSLMNNRHNNGPRHEPWGRSIVCRLLPIKSAKVEGRGAIFLPSLQYI